MPFGADTRGGSQGTRPLGLIEHAEERHGQGFWPIGLHEDAGRVRYDQLRNPAHPGCDDGKTRCHGFEDAVWARLGSRRQNEDIALRQKRRDVTPFSEKCHVRADSEACHTVPEFFPQWAVSDEYEFRVGAPSGLPRPAREPGPLTYFSGTNRIAAEFMQ